MTTKPKQTKQATKKPKPVTVKAKRQMVKDKHGFLTVRAAAQALAVHENSIRQWGKDGTVPSVITVGGYRRFDPKVIAKLAKKMGSKQENLITASMASDILGTHRNTVTNLNKRGVLKGYAFPGSHYHRYRRSDVEALAEQLQTSSEE